MTVLGVDPGSRKVGVAVLTAKGEVPFRAIFRPEGLLEEVRPLLERYRIEAIAVGGGTRGTETLDRLGELGLPCERVDETSTTLDAQSSFSRRIRRRVGAGLSRAECSSRPARSTILPPN